MKKVGLNHGWSSTWILATFCFLSLLPIWMTLLLPTIFLSTIKLLVNTASQTVHYVEHDFPDELLSWLSYLFYPAISSMLSNLHIAISGIMAIPIYFWTLFWHTDGCLIIEMLCNPEGNGCFVQYKNDVNCYCWRERSRSAPWRAQQTRIRCIWICLSNQSDTGPIWGYDSRLCMFSHYQIHLASINKTAGGALSEDGVSD